MIIWDQLVFEGGTCAMTVYILRLRLNFFDRIMVVETLPLTSSPRSII